MRATFVTLASYDWRWLPRSIAAYYDHADEILVGLDRDGLSWSGTPLDMNEDDGAAFTAMLDEIDRDGKIEVITGSFFDRAKTPIENDNAQRSFIAKQARNDWVVEVDADEILIDAPTLFATMETCPPGRQVYAQEWTTVFKVIGETALVVTPSLELCALATCSRRRVLARQTGEPAVIAPVDVVHFCTARDEAELARKITSWGHSTKVRPGWLDLWRSVDLSNYDRVNDLHYSRPARWRGLKAVPLQEIQQCPQTLI